MRTAARSSADGQSEMLPSHTPTRPSSVTSRVYCTIRPFGRRWSHGRSGDLEARLALLEAEQAILKNLYRYGHSIDYGDEEGWVDCFTEDGVFDVRARLSHQPNRVISGRDELRAFIKRHTRAPELWHKHLLIEPLIEVDGDTATVRSYLAVVMEHDDEPIVRVFGRYRRHARTLPRRALALPRARSPRSSRCAEGCRRSSTAGRQQA